MSPAPRATAIRTISSAADPTATTVSTAGGVPTSEAAIGLFCSHNLGAACGASMQRDRSGSLSASPGSDRVPSTRALPLGIRQVAVSRARDAMPYDFLIDTYDTERIKW